MALLSLELIGWLFAIGSGIALAFGIWLIVGIHLRDEAARKQLAARALEDTLLFGIWLLGLAGGIGVLTGRAWSRPALEFFCATLVILLLLSSWNRWRAAPKPRGMMAVSLALFVIPVTVFCVATIVTLRSEMALSALSR